jgi:hypothetical protein
VRSTGGYARTVTQEHDVEVAQLLSVSLDENGLYVHLRFSDRTDTEFTAPLESELARRVNTLVGIALVEYYERLRGAPIAIRDIRQLGEEWYSDPGDEGT